VKYNTKPGKSPASARRHLEEDVAPKEGAGGHAIPSRVEPQIIVHHQRGKADIDAIEIAKYVRTAKGRIRRYTLRIAERSTVSITSSSKPFD
jgi:hypothetical protein